MAKKATPRTRRSPPKAPASIDKLSDAPMPVTSHRAVEAAPAQAEPVIGGPKMGYRDTEDAVEYRVFEGGIVPDGWHDTPAKCEHNYRDGLVRAK